MAEASIPASAYVRYIGPGDMYLVRCQIGPYRVIVEAAKGVPYAVPVSVAELLPPGEFEHVDVADAIEEIVLADQQAAEADAEWRAHQAEIQRRKATELTLRPIHTERVEVMRQAVIDARSNGGTDTDVLARAVAAAIAYEEALRSLDPDRD